MNNMKLASVIGLSFCFIASASAQEVVTRTERLVLSPVSTAASQSFGASVATDSGRSVYGAPGANSGAGTATILDRGSSNTWSVSATLVASDAAASDAFGASVALQGDIVVVGAPFGPGGASANQGAVYVFRKSGATWTQVAKLTASDGVAGDQFGAAVSMNGDSVVVGAPGADVAGAADRGAAYVFRNSTGNTWVEQSKLTASDGAVADHFGASVAMRSSRALIGAPAHAAGAGAAYLFRNTGSWSQAAVFAAGEPGAIGYGTSVALSGTIAGDWAFVGAPDALNSGLPCGAAFVYQRATDLSWPSAARITPSDAAAGDRFGAALAASDDRLVGGAPLDTVRGVASAGSATVYRRMGTGVWQEGSKLAASTGSVLGGFANALAIAGERVMVGAPTTANGALNRGAGYHYRLEYARAGLDDNGRSDVFWFSPASGNIAAWTMNGLAKDGGGIVPNTIAGHEYLGVGDFHGDGRSSVLFRNKTTGAFRAWRLNGLAVSDDRAISGGVGLDWEYLALTDISGDGKADVILRNCFTGQVNAWIMSGGTKTSGGAVGNALGLIYAGVADLDGDGRGDILWRTAAGEMRAWMMNGLTIVSDSPITGVTPVTAEWKTVAIADLDGDGKRDIVWRNSVTGAVTGWMMDGTALKSSGVMNAGIPLNWRVEAAGDLNSDGNEDLLWRNMSTGDVNAWLMNGFTKTAGSFVKNVATSWSMLNDDDYNDDHGRDGVGDDDNRDDSNENDYDDSVGSGGNGGNGGSNGGSNGGGGNSGGGGSGNNATVSCSSYTASINAAMTTSSLPVLESEVELQSGVYYVAVTQWRASNGQLVRVVVNAATRAIVSTTSWTPTAAQLANYSEAIGALSSATVSSAAAVTTAINANPTGAPHSAELAQENSGPKWEIKIVFPNGTTSKVQVAAN